MSNEPSSPGASDETLRHLHAAYSERFLADNGRIWITAATLVPLALAGLPLLVLQGHPTVGSSVAVGIASTALLLFWTWVAEAHRWFQDCSIAQVNKIETLLGYVKADLPPKPTIRVATARRLLIIIVVLTWTAITTLVAFGYEFNPT
jgi:hypothetical protein